MIFEDFDKKIENVIIKQKKQCSYKKFCKILSEHYPSDEVKDDLFLDFINNLTHLKSELKISTTFEEGISKCSLAFNDFSIVYEEKDNNKGRFLNYYIFKPEVNHDIIAKVYCSALNGNQPIVTFETIEGELLFHYDVNDNFCFIKTFEPVAKYYSYTIEHFSDNDINEYLFLNYDFKSDSLISILRKVNTILN